jgi:hypothetical protein
MEESASTLQIWGAIGFGTLIGWYVYYVNRHRTEKVQLSDIVTLIGAIGGAAILAIFPAKSDLFGAYGIGLAAGFFGYFLVMAICVGVSKNFKVDWFLDGRRTKPGDNETDGPTGAGVAMVAEGRDGGG